MKLVQLKVLYALCFSAVVCANNQKDNLYKKFSTTNTHEQELSQLSSMQWVQLCSYLMEEMLPFIKEGKYEKFDKRTSDIISGTVGICDTDNSKFMEDLKGALTEDGELEEYFTPQYFFRKENFVEMTAKFPNVDDLVNAINRLKEKYGTDFESTIKEKLIDALSRENNKQRNEDILKRLNFSEKIEEQASRKAVPVIDLENQNLTEEEYKAKIDFFIEKEKKELEKNKKESESFRPQTENDINNAIEKIERLKIKLLKEQEKKEEKQNEIKKIEENISKLEEELKNEENTIENSITRLDKLDKTIASKESTLEKYIKEKENLEAACRIALEDGE